MSFQSFCFPSNSTAEDTQGLSDLKLLFKNIQIVLCVFGIIGNILNLRTLQCPSLKTIPFMYIRALAIFDLCALALIVLHFALSDNGKKSYLAMAYVNYLDACLINGFLIAGLYCAFMLTIERFILITRPHLARSSNPKKTCRRRIVIAVLAAFLLHVPMAVQTTVQQSSEGIYTIVNHKGLLCQEPYWTIFQTYKVGRECLRFMCVIVMTALNVVIARKLQIAKRNRRVLLNKTPKAPPKPPNFSNHRSSIAYHSDAYQQKEFASVVKSFTEKKLTVLMVAICFIFILGNVPQMLVMLFQNEATEQLYGFQLYRQLANVLEVLNHCLNFYVFCMASSEYTRAFIVNCFCLRHVISLCPGCVKLVNRRRSSSLSFGQSVNNSVMVGQIKDSSDDDMSMVQKDVVVRWKPDSETGTDRSQQTPLVHQAPNRGILRKDRNTSNSFRSHSQSITIANPNAQEMTGEEEERAFHEENQPEVYI
ncbi:unnamed protein product, partial [Mesorhabditis belari]|uniref:G-protein coupled receptors family 1 profile domain-containing protein n=1 Tax=Mesorhabditis belari TaxID=2138241 RepID=A0AAF3FJ45_9BILA